MKKRLLLLLGMTLFLCQAINAQSWQWGKRGGSSDTYGTGADEKVVDMTTDRQGNVYILSSVMQTGLNVDGHPVTEWGDYDMLITSFKCDGSYRWSKDIGNSNRDIPVALKTDTLGGVYVTGFSLIYGLTVHIDADTTVYSASAFKSLLLVKFDTAGNYKWLKMPEPDTTTVSGATARPLDMDVDGGGNVYWMCALPPGAFADGSYVVTTKGVYILKYDRYGNFISGTQMQISYDAIAVGGLFMKRDKINGRYYITGYVGGGVTVLSFNGTAITHALFVGCFNSSGTFLWEKQDVQYGGGGFPRVEIDAIGNIFLSSQTINNDTFNTYVPANAFYAAPFITEMDSNGNFIWAKNATTNGACGCSAAMNAGKCAILNGGEIDISGFCGKLVWPGYPDSLNIAFGLGSHIFTTRFNAVTGVVLGLDSLISTTGTNNEVTALASDAYGSFYIGGDFQSGITVNGSTLTSAGGGSDFFVAKYGYSNCSNPGALEAPPGLPQGEEMEVRVYPNPATDEINIEHAGVGSTIRLLNMVGQQVYSAVVSSDKEVINMGHLVRGTYLLQITQADGNRVVRTLVKE